MHLTHIFCVRFPNSSCEVDLGVNSSPHRGHFFSDIYLSHFSVSLSLSKILIVLISGRIRKSV